MRAGLSDAPLVLRPGGGFKRAGLRPWLVVVVLFSAWALAGCSAGLGNAEKPPLVASGTIRAMEVRISSELGGRVAEIPVQLGQSVTEGEVLARLDATPWELQLQPAEAGVGVARQGLLKDKP